MQHRLRHIRRSALLVLLAGCIVSLVLLHTRAEIVPQPPFTVVQQLASLHESGVKVELALERDSRGNAMLAGTFTPLDPDSHIYSVDLPAEGIDGAGRPTRLFIFPGQPVQGIGRVLVDKSVELRAFEGFSTPFPIYPNGAVTLRVPMAGVADSHPSETQISVSYMACSSRGYCLPPVENRLVVVKF